MNFASQNSALSDNEFLKKSWAHVWRDKICSTYHLITPVTSVDRYDPKLVYKYIIWAVVSRRKFSSAARSSTFISLKLSFLEPLPSNMLLGGMNLEKTLFAYVSVHKICSTYHMITLVTSVDRYEPKETSNTIVGWWKLTKCFFKTHKVTEDFHKNSLF